MKIKTQTKFNIILFLLILFSLGFGITSLFDLFEIKKDILLIVSGVFFSFGILLYISFNSIISHLKVTFTTMQKYNQELEANLSNNKKEKDLAIEKIQTVDNELTEGYYFLNSISKLLINNGSKSSTVTIEFLIEQKKKLNYAGDTFELGGDVSITGNLSFFDKPYTLFFSGDSSGNAFQASIGSAIISSLIHSILLRFTANKRVITKDPDRWLRETFKEIQSVMEIFQKSILLSCILGLVEDETGVVRFFNAECPYSVLYKSGNALYLEAKNQLRKLGDPANEDIELSQFQLEPKDILFCGSFGRESLKVHQDKEKFLQTIEESEGNLEKIFQTLNKKQSLESDLSIVRISYRENEINPIQPQKEETLNSSPDLIADLMKEKKFLEAYTKLEEESNETNLVNVYRRAYCLHKLERKEDAVSLLISFKDRILTHPKILKLLSKIYFEIGNYSEAEFYADRVLDLNPDETQTLALKEKMKSVRSF